MKILHIQSGPELDTIRTLFQEYERFLGVDLCFQGFEQELAGLPGAYARPGGALLLAVDQGDAAGCVALRPLQDGACEMKRLYVRDDYRGRGLGRRLAEQTIAEARAMGYACMRLDTLERLTAAVALYRSLGFRERPGYYDNPLHGVTYWELALATPQGGTRTAHESAP
jgi:ribosomal protein S18 acetylase RimI-like enzyme